MPIPLVVGASAIMHIHSAIHVVKQYTAELHDACFAGFAVKNLLSQEGICLKKYVQTGLCQVLRSPVGLTGQ